jgi:hypothetical protein
MDGLGRVLNVQPAMDGVFFNVKNVDGVTFLGYLAGAVGDTYTLQEARSQAGLGAQNLVAVAVYHTSTGNGADVWVRRTQAAAATVVTAASAVQNAVVFEVDTAKLSDGYSWLKVTSTGAGLVIPIPRDLKIQRTPANLPAFITA